MEGDASQFIGLFDDFVPDILQLVVSTWKKFRHCCPYKLEVPINKWFRSKLIQEKELIDYFPFRIYAEIDIPDKFNGETKGRIDIRFDPTLTTNEEIYFAFECKRLRIRYSSGITPSTDKYVGEGGMMCFINEQYSEDLPAGGMIGYVMDGKITLAIQSVKNAIDKKRVKLCMVSESSLSPSSILPDESSVKETIHNLPTRSFTIHHIFLAA